ncbi:major facilitator superfamily transporter [Colletotrichum graminicola]|uniref:Major facilitator superfamily transporter n=1 Tax=Colletotrichum graminicola (strain M1.001 / M2 / FGSC 10212) TaxID=645133 RepID=E3QVX8_COLGM|nr:major facilitator superfamily transporter [Colletotrichum graminicola M1.001]EFQ35016.1 major facilitator superfamily transporter [Colletotrichum graminicola M1.001]WDK20365.1 major facilitator superfamily transporter [Colletotrichum graminicola]
MTDERALQPRDRQHAADNETGTAGGVSSAEATEATPLLNSGASSPTLRDGSLGGNSRRDRDSDVDVDEDDDAGPKQSISVTRAGVLMLSTWILIFLQASNTSGMTMTQSVVAEDLEAYADAMWFTSSYLISMASLTPLFGRLATIFSPRSLVLPLGCFFAAGGVVTSQASSFWVFIAGRILSGMGGAGIMTLSIILVLELVGKKSRGLFVGLVNTGFTIGLSFGAVVSGALLPAIGWRALFGLQAPLGLFAGLGAFWSIPKTFSSDHEAKSRPISHKLARIDYAGAFMLVLTIVLFLYGLSGEIQTRPLIFSALSLLLFIFIEFKFAADPIIPISLLTSRPVLLSCVAQLFFMSIRWTLLYYAPIFALAVRGYAPAIAGSILVPTNIGFGSGGLVVGWLHVRRNGAFWTPSVISLTCFAVTMFCLSLVGTADSPFWVFVLAVVLNGFATGATLNYTLAHMLHLSRPEEHFVSTSLLGTFRGFGGSFGTAIGGGIFYRLLRSGLLSSFRELDGGRLSEERKELVTKLIGSPALVFNGRLAPAEHAIAVERYASALRGTWRVAAALAFVAVVIQASTGWRGPAGRRAVGDEIEARAVVTESEGVGEA